MEHNVSGATKGQFGRRQFLKQSASVAALAAVGGGLSVMKAQAQSMQQEPPPMALGLLIHPYPDPEARIRLVHEMGFTTCFFSLDGYLGKFTPELAKQIRDLLDKYQVIATTAEVVRPNPLKWNFTEGPATIGIVPRAYRQARMDALMQTSDFARLVGIRRIQTHCGFIPEDPHDPLYEESVTAIRTLTEHCAANGQMFLMETGQETPTTVSRMIKDVNNPALGVGLDTANLILYGKANPVDAVKILGPHIKAMHAKDGNWPTDPDLLGKEVKIGEGQVDFKTVFKELRAANYTGAVSIERETSGPKQIEDVKDEKIYLERMLVESRA